MNGLKYLLDTNFIIGLLKGDEASVAIASGINLAICSYSAITRMELLSYPDLTEVESLVINRLLARMNYIAISPEIEDLTIVFRQQHKVKLPDAIIAATAKAQKIGLLTFDKKLAAKL
ncbi:putative nucleic acid-binding protein [Crenothrix polyspora]|uniref:Putative nucleic acid-binding protein n=1 Tax=Crenothrix polyspora TaxID=360316 RepID=A0A1R4HGQ0_9GAMM|nr:type II toxin-antitoxin system VapC family toxin [Crenothrix polyspora]SJM95412.1 putative nucleic acid-binding protein [Crenothrix polyspora]